MLSRLTACLLPSDVRDEGCSRSFFLGGAAWCKLEAGEGMNRNVLGVRALEDVVWGLRTTYGACLYPLGDLLPSPDRLLYGGRCQELINEKVSLDLPTRREHVCTHCDLSIVDTMRWHQIQVQVPHSRFNYPTRSIRRWPCLRAVDHTRDGRRESRDTRAVLAMIVSMQGIQPQGEARSVPRCRPRVCI